ncbi:MAG: MarR family transcriptional regulator [Sandaracinaceae bacterium]|nr:MarR family transcriptional regulator [Sandaracinaceae bacterium]
MGSRYEESILRSLRRISRAIDLHSKQLARQHELTGPQLVCLREIARAEGVTPSALARAVSLSGGTVTGIVDRLVARGLATRERSADDKRQVLLRLTPSGRAAVAAAPSPLHEDFRARLARLPEGEQAMIDWVVARVVGLFGAADDEEAAPLLMSGPAGAEPEDVLRFFQDDAPKSRGPRRHPQKKPRKRA